METNLEVDLFFPGNNILNTKLFLGTCEGPGEGDLKNEARLEKLHI